MKKTIILPVLAVAMCLSNADISRAASTSSDEEWAVSASAHFYSGHTMFPEYPFGDGDMSYQLAAELHGSSAYWQFAVAYAPESSATNALGEEYVDSVITPQISIIAKEQRGAFLWHAGVGILTSMVSRDIVAEGEDKDDWTDIYWNLLLGIGVPLGMFDISGSACYTFDEWGNLSEFDAGDIEYLVNLTYHF